MIDLGESRADVLTFLRGLFADLGSEERIEVRVLNQGGTKLWMCDSAESVVAAVEKGADDGENVYFGVLPRRKGVRSGKRENVTRGTAAWIDLDADISAAEARARVNKYAVKPSYVVKSGHGYHVYWLLSERVEREDLGKLEQLNRAIAEIVGADVACHDAARILRLPGTRNYKHEEVRECKFVGKPTRKPARHTLEALVAAAVFGRSHPSTGSGCGAGDAVPRSPDLAHADGQVVRGRETRAQQNKGRSARNGWNGVAEGNRNNELFLKACDLRERRVPEDLALGALREWNQRNMPPLPEQELSDTVIRVYNGVSRYTPQRVTGDAGFIGDGGGATGTAGEIANAVKCYKAAELASMAPSGIDFTVEKLVPSKGVTIFSGEGGIGKSFIALDMAMAVATGTVFLDSFSCQQGRVIYVDLENDEWTIGRRIKQLAAGRGIDPDSLDIFVPMRGAPGVELQQDTPEGRAWLWAAIEQYKPRLVVIDSLIACHSGDENNNGLMRQLMAGLDGMARVGSLGMLVVHHQRKRGVNNDAGQLMRGASDLRNSVVSHFAVRRMRGDSILCVHDKCRPAQPASPFSLTIRDTEDGGVTVELETQTAVPEQPDCQSGREERALQALRERGPRTPQQLYEAIGASERTGQRALLRLSRRGEILKWPDGLYRLCENDALLDLSEGGEVECAA